MSRPEPADADLPFLDQLLAVGADAPPLARKVDMAHAARTSSPDAGRRLDHVLLDRLARTTVGLRVAEAAQQELRDLLEQAAAPPWYPALFVRAVDTELGPRALVMFGGARRLVAVADDVDLEDLVVGEEVFLGRECNVVTGRAPYGAPQCGETACFDRLTGGGRCVLRWRDEEVVVDAAGMLDPATLAPGDQVRWDRAAWLVFEKIEAAAGRRVLLDEVPDVGRGRVGGQDAQLDALLAALTASLIAPGRAAIYGLGGRRSILMVGPPGCGKTLMARVAAAEITRLGGRRCRFGVVKPAAWESPYVGETQQNIAACFKALREAAAAGFAVLFLDEVEAVGRIRGGAVGHHADKFLAALLAELDGFTERQNVAIIAATNRKDLVDPALLERLSDVEIAVSRPDMRGATAILEIHLPETMPFAAGVERRVLIDAAVSRLYAPNAETALATLRLRDGTTRTVTARALLSGRILAQICRAAAQTALSREVRGGEPGLRLADVEDAIDDALHRLATTLAPRNAAAYLADLPQDVDVVSVEPLIRRVVRAHRYRHAA
jgi:ATP-dependent 26S proteasome regulatory subunit